MLEVETCTLWWTPEKKRTLANRSDWSKNQQWKAASCGVPPLAKDSRGDNQLVLPVPELCRMTGQTDKIRYILLFGISDFLANFLACSSIRVSKLVHYDERQRKNAPWRTRHLIAGKAQIRSLPGMIRNQPLMEVHLSRVILMTVNNKVKLKCFSFERGIFGYCVNNLEQYVSSRNAWALFPLARNSICHKPY